MTFLCQDVSGTEATEWGSSQQGKMEGESQFLGYKENKLD